MTPKQIGAAVRKARGQRSIREVAGAAGLHRDQVTGIEAATATKTTAKATATAQAKATATSKATATDTPTH